ncbi:MAG: rhodanese-like domain-containing protein [Erysipelotrichaceae bacterium]
MKKILICIILFIMCGCTVKEKEITVVEKTDNEVISLPVKTGDSNNMSDSPINPKNLDDYLFREDCFYVDTRDPKQFYEEGSVAGFVNIPFYGYICDFKKGTGSLFTFTKVSDEILLGDPGSFIASYEESEEIIKSIFPMDKNIIVIATAGVESCYLLNLLVQLGYDSDKLYNAGSFTTGMGDDIAYVSYKDAKYLIRPVYLDDTDIFYSFEGLTPVE